MRYGTTIGKKFYEDGTIKHYPGCTVVADVTPDCPAYEVMLGLRQMLIDAGFEKDMILLPTDSYHMTVIRGLNDYVRDDAFWPEKLPKDTPMTKVDDYVSAAVASVPALGKIRMKFKNTFATDGCLMIRLVPEDDAQEKILRDYRDQVATAIGLFLPRHATYNFHISLAYVRVVPEGEDRVRYEKMLSDMEAYMANRPAFEITPPYMAYYDDMLAYHSERIPRD